MPALTETRRKSAWPWLAALWLLVVLGLGWQQAMFWQSPRLDSDVLALLPGLDASPAVATASERLAGQGTRQLVVLLGHEDPARARAASLAFAASLDGDDRLRALPADATGAEALATYAAFQRGLLTREQRLALEQGDPAALANEALARLFAPGVAPRWAADPLGLDTGWWQARAGQGPRFAEGWLSLRADGRHWGVQRFELVGSAFALDGERHLQVRLDRAFAAARAVAGDGLVRMQAGVPLHAEAAAVQANREVATIGLGSLAAVLLLVWLAFRSLRPIVLVALSLAVGVAAGVAATDLVFGSVHLLTLVFGASLVGVAEDYGIHYFASRQQSDTPPRTLLRQLLPALALALATSVLAYLALAIAPFPGLRQMAVFSAAGLAAAFLTVVLWFPWLDRRAPRHSRFSDRVAATLARWPRWPAGRAGLVPALALGAFLVAGLLQLQPRDDLRSLQASPLALLESERDVGRLLDLPSPAQFFLVSGATPEDLLQAEERLLDRLAPLRAQGVLGGWRAVSDWLPSMARQQADARLRAAVEEKVLAAASATLGETLVPAPDPSAWLEPGTALAWPALSPLQPLWLGEQAGAWHSLVLVSGIGHESLGALAALHAPAEGVAWVDRAADYSGLLAHYRVVMGWLLLAGYAAVILVLHLRFGRSAWRAWLPTVLAALSTLALLGWLGMPLQLFGVLAQLLLLGFGVDYGIFLLEHRGDPSSWLAVSLGACSTTLSFGLLALSATPALQGFGLSLLVGLALVWLATPLFRQRPASPAPALHH
ncbi:hypothetical protein C6N40_03435 [Arenimonas caeni]|uniref:Membrane transport protein MMPL domain-containing protein n=1 Tax=Arenimonas caeni TaxID=2058085 RepID=A0A2P6MBJ6_9GAMM|nr:hypothetical protein C6N40_03435 [Arenimonas caeni]